MDRILARDFIFSLLKYGLRMCSIAMVVRYTGHDIYGDVVFALALLTSLGPCTALGMSYGVNKHVPKVLAEDTSFSLQGYFSWQLRALIWIVMALAVFGVLGYSALSFAYAQGLFSFGRNRYILFDLVLLFLPWSAIRAWTGSIILQSCYPMFNSWLQNGYLLALGISTAFLYVLDIPYSYALMFYLVAFAVVFEWGFAILVTVVGFVKEYGLSFSLDDSDLLAEEKRDFFRKIWRYYLPS